MLQDYLVPKELYVIEHTKKCYCEAIIDSNGYIKDAIPSHVYGLLRIIEKDKGITKQEIEKEMPLRAGPLNWLVNKYNYCCVWYDSAIVSTDYSDAILDTIQYLVNKEVLRSPFKVFTTDEYKRCLILEEYDDTHDTSLLETLKNTPKSNMIEILKQN